MPKWGDISNRKDPPKDSMSAEHFPAHLTVGHNGMPAVFCGGTPFKGRARKVRENRELLLDGFAIL